MAQKERQAELLLRFSPLGSSMELMQENSVECCSVLTSEKGGYHLNFPS